MTAVSLRADYSAVELMRRAISTRNANQSRRFLSLAAVQDGMNRTERRGSAGWTGRRCGLGAPVQRQEPLPSMLTASMVIEIRQDRTRRLNQSATAARFSGPPLSRGCANGRKAACRHGVSACISGREKTRSGYVVSQRSAPRICATDLPMAEWYQREQDNSSRSTTGHLTGRVQEASGALSQTCPAFEVNQFSNLADAKSLRTRSLGRLRQRRRSVGLRLWMQFRESHAPFGLLFKA